MASIKYKTEDGYVSIPLNIIGSRVYLEDYDDGEVVPELVDDSAKIGNGIGTCSTSSGTALEVDINNYKLVKSGIVTITFQYDVPANATLNINNQGAKAIYKGGSAITEGVIKAGSTIMLTYDGTNYVVSSQEKYSSHEAVSGGTTESLCTTGEKYIWNNKANNSTMIGASSSDAGTSGLVPAPAAGDQVKFLKGNGVWTVPTYGDINYSINTSSNVSGAVSVDGTIPIHVLTLSGNVSSVSLSANPPEGHSCHIIFASATTYTIAIAHHSTDRICPEAKNVLLEVSAGGYIEVDFFNVDNKIYVRGV